jgi:hypothetical protein
MANGRSDPLAVRTAMRAYVSRGGGSLTGERPAGVRWAVFGRGQMAKLGWDISLSSGGAPLVPMVQAADLGQPDHLTALWRRDRAVVRRVLHEG